MFKLKWKWKNEQKPRKPVCSVFFFFEKTSDIHPWLYLIGTWKRRPTKAARYTVLTQGEILQLKLQLNSQFNFQFNFDFISLEKKFFIEQMEEKEQRSNTRGRCDRRDTTKVKWGNGRSRARWECVDVIDVRTHLDRFSICCNFQQDWQL